MIMKNFRLSETASKVVLMVLGFVLVTALSIAEGLVESGNFHILLIMLAVPSYIIYRMYKGGHLKWTDRIDY